MSNQLATQPKHELAVTVKSLLGRDDFKKRFEEMLGKRAGQFLASVTNLSRDQNMQGVDPMTIIGAAVIAASLDLPVDKNLGFAWIVPYREKGTPRAQFQLGWKGIVQLALRTAQYERLNARPINQEALGGYDSVGEPIILWDKIDESKEPIGYACAWRLVSGFSKTCYWSRKRVEAHAARYSMAYRKGAGPWKTHFEQMALKTVIKNELSDWGIMSIEMMRAAQFDQGVKSDIEVDSAVIYPDREGKRPQLEGPSPDDIDVGGREEDATPGEEASAAASTATAIDAAAIDKPFEHIQGLCKRDGVTEAQVHRYMRENKLAGEKTEELGQTMDKNMRTVIGDWANALPKIQAIKL